MISEWDIYWITMLDRIGVTCWSLMIMSFVVAICSTGIYFEISKNLKEKTRYALNVLYKISWVLVIISFMGSTFLPSSKQLCAIKVIPAMIDNKNIDKNSPVYKMAMSWIDSKITPPKPDFIKEEKDNND